MKKMLGLLITVLCVIFVLSFSASATQDETPVLPVPSEEIVNAVRIMGDIDNNGSVTAGDARLILRYSVELESFTAENIIYADVDFNNRITASDARTALRTSVSLEEEQKYAFVITHSAEATCTDDGSVTAQCQLTQKTVSLTIKAYGHSLPQDAACREEAECGICKEIIKTVNPGHDFKYDYDNSKRICRRCGISEAIEHTHNFSDGKCICGNTAKTALEKFMRKYIKKVGKYGEEYYYVDEYIEPLNFFAIYDETVDLAYAVCVLGVEQDGITVYYDFYFYFDDNTVEALMYTEDRVIASVSGKIDPAKVDESANGDAVTIDVFDAAPELNGYEHLFRTMLEGAVYDTVVWMRAVSDNAGFGYTDEAFSDYKNVK